MALIQKYYSGSQVYDIIRELHDKEFLLMLNTFAEASGADVVERKTGKWLKSNESTLRPYMCSNCGCLHDVDTVMGKIVWNYCPNCGARMERRDDEL